jgi:hypothetical protein
MNLGALAFLVWVYRYACKCFQNCLSKQYYALGLTKLVNFYKDGLGSSCYFVGYVPKDERNDKVWKQL